jgi:ATP-binding cassette, subfamily B, bacterial PglK
MLDTYSKINELLSTKEKKGFYLLIMIMVFGAILEMIGIGIIPAYISIIAFPEQIENYKWFQLINSNIYYDLNNKGVLIYWGSMVLVIFFLIKSIYSVFTTYCKVRFTHNRALKLSVQLYENYLNAPYTYHIENGTPKLLRNIIAESRMLSTKVLMPFVSLISQVLVLIGILIILIFTVPLKILFSLLAFLVIAMASTILLEKKIKLLGVEAQMNRRTMVVAVKEGLEGVKEVKLLNRITEFSNRLFLALKRVLMIQRIMMVLQQALPSFIELIVITGLLGVTVISFSSGERPEIIVPTLVIFTVALARMKGCMGSILKYYTDIKHNNPSLNVVYDGIKNFQDNSFYGALNRNIKENSATLKRLSFKDKLELKGVWYKYPGEEKYSLKDINLTISAREAIGIVGKTGAGKSTLIDIITGLLPPSRGQILVDGIDIHINLREWQNGIGYVPQSIFLMDGSIFENLTLGIKESEYSNERAEYAINAASLTSYIEESADGLNTNIGDRGIRMSGGERQRLAIARALYIDPELLVMDEPTSALDNETESHVISAVNKLKGEQTILVIAHRLSTVQNCDRIIVLLDGKLNGFDTHENLKKNNSYFYKINND